ncbi:MAG: type VII secretion protein EccE [Mycobacteriaceae bacterium]|nr:type VII secretion protein EccE [Mycobacteriaceae bacterium]
MADVEGAGPAPVFGRIAPVDLVAAQLVGVSAGALALVAGVALAPAVAVAVGVAALLLIPVGRRTATGWLRVWWGFLGKRRTRLGSTVDFRAPGGRSLGLYWDGSRVVSVVEVLAPLGGLTRISRDAFDSSHKLPLPALAACLTQHDVMLDSIDIVSHGFRTRPGTPAGQVYEQLIGPLPATAVRTVWLAVSLDMRHCKDAVERRGGGAEGASRSVTIATQRIVRALAEAGCRSRILTAPEIRDAVIQITAGTDPRTVGQRWSSARLGNFANIGSAVDPDKLSSETLAKLWSTPSLGTTVAVRLEPGATPDTIKLGAAWRLTAQDPPQVKLPGLISVNGRHREALLAQLPLGAGTNAHTIPTGEFPLGATERLHLPQAGCGQLIGSDRNGQGIAARIVGAGISTVYVASDPFVAKQLVFRALAVGSRILIRTDRPQVWHQFIASIENPERLTFARDATQSNAGFNATLVDGVAAPAPHAGVTTIYLAADPSGWPTGRPDIAIHQPGAQGNRLRLQTAVAAVDLNLVALPRENAFIGQPYGARQPVG